MLAEDGWLEVGYFARAGRASSAFWTGHRLPWGDGVRISQSLWLPVGRANFFSVPEDREFIHALGDGDKPRCSAVADHHPNLQVSTVRRLLEVLPKFYGYDAIALFESGELTEVGQPVKVTLSLTPEQGHDGPDGYRRAQINGYLVHAGVTELTLTVTEDGFFTWTAVTPGDDAIATADLPAANRSSGDPQLVREALRAHIKELFGGDFSLHRYDRKGQVSGDDAAETYRGKKKEDCKQKHTAHQTAGADGADREDGRTEHYPPLGILTFFQLNTLLEGLINETLLPAVFFEEYDFLKAWVRNGPYSRGFRSLGTFVELLLVDTDATGLAGQIATLDHFLAVTAREVLQKIKWSVESVRRGLLDEMMSVLHRQSSLNQLGLGSFERSPEQAGDANESQLRGYVMLVAAKLPLITNVHRFARSALSRLDLELKDSTTGENKAVSHNYADLRYQLSGWHDLLEALAENIGGLETAIEHAWMERLLYEQEQVRAEQEAMAEIERSRNGRRPFVSPETAINSAVLVFAVAAVVLTAKTASEPSASHPLWTLLLLPSILGLGVLVLAVGWTFLTRYLKIWRSTTDVCDYEFAFRLDLKADEAKTQRYLELSGPESVSGTGFDKFKVLRRGGARIERITPDSSLVKLHSAIIFRPDTGFWRRSRARFEIVTEILGHRASNKNQYILRESRIFGDTSSPLAPDKVMALVTAALTVTAGRLLYDNLDVKKIIDLAAPVFRETTADEGAEGAAETAAV
jgi:hypothetical protein